MSFKEAGVDIRQLVAVQSAIEYTQPRHGLRGCFIEGSSDRGALDKSFRTK
jgi:hypothetical protein